MSSSTPKGSRFFGAVTQAQQQNTEPLIKTDPYWDSTAAEDLGPNWDKLYPYQFLTLRKSGKSYRIQERFTLPIPPQSLSISTPFAINTSVTMGGIFEEHNGAPIRMIALQGTTGLLPLKGAVARPSVFETAVGGIFAGTVTGVRQVATAISQARNLLGIAQTPNAVSDADLALAGIRGTGYYQFVLLKRFLEAYATAKKNGDKDLRLGFAIWKEKEIYLVTPVSFDVSRQAASPFEYPYSISLKAWRRVLIEGPTGASDPYDGHVGGRNPNKLAMMLNTLETGRRILEGVRDTLQGVRADIQQVLYTPLRQSLLLIKDATGTALAAVDLPTDIIGDLREPILEIASSQASIQALSRAGSRFLINFDAATGRVRKAFEELSVSSGKADTRAGRSRSGGLSGDPQNQNNAAEANKVSENPLDNFSFFEGVQLGDLNLRPEVIQKIEQERQSVKNLGRKDFEGFRDNVLRVAADFADFVGAGSATYTSTYNLPVRSTNRTPTDTEWEVLYTLSQVAQQFDVMAASATIAGDQVTSMDYVAGLATRSGIAFQVARSKFAVPFPYGYTLEKLSNQYLGTPDRWLEIATLNGLRAPYVDEVGFKLPLLTNGNGHQIIVSDATNLYVGQKVWLASNNQKRESRRIQEVRPIGANQFAVLVDGADDLSKFSPVASAYLQAFLPGTVNSQQQIYIPSDVEPAEEDFRVKSIPGVDYFDPLVRSGGIDLLLTPDGDLVITPDGDSRLAIGLTNLIQKARLAIGTPKGALLHHPDYGIGLTPGVSTYDLNASQVLTDLKQLFKDDAGYLGVQSASVLKNGNTMQVRASIGIAGTGQYIPITVTIDK